ncbi:MAG: DNA recombination protein RmuC [Candidatus Aminicenantes bacterium]|nr:DNA recombination protein RmuC [Candidatus Aminicenantes bacterium]
MASGVTVMTLTILAIALSSALFVLLLILFLSLRARLTDIKRGQADVQALGLMQQQIGQLNQSLNLQLTNSTSSLQDQFNRLAQNMNQQLQGLNSQFQKTTGDIGHTLGAVKQDMGRMETATREVLDKARSIAQLEELLRAPKFRGGMSELFLADLLAQILPPTHFTLQHRFKSGEKVDAAVKIGANLVPIDAKFPLENFRKLVQEDNDKQRDALRKKFMADVKKHVDDIASKYILPEEGTYDFALMYIPAENIYYETILRDENLGQEKSLLSYAQHKRVIPVSPNSFFAYLQVIVLGLKGLQVEKSALAISRGLRQLQGDLERFKGDFSVLGSHLTNARSKYEDSEKRLDRFSDKLELMHHSCEPEKAGAEVGSGAAAGDLPEK